MESGTNLDQNPRVDGFVFCQLRDCGRRNAGKLLKIGLIQITIDQQLPKFFIANHHTLPLIRQPIFYQISQIITMKRFVFVKDFFKVISLKQTHRIIPSRTPRASSS